MKISYVVIEGSKNKKVKNLKGTAYNGTARLIFMFSFDGFVWWSRHSQWWEDLHPGIPHNHKEIRDKGWTSAKSEYLKGRFKLTFLWRINENFCKKRTVNKLRHWRRRVKKAYISFRGATVAKNTLYFFHSCLSCPAMTLDKWRA